MPDDPPSCTSTTRRRRRRDSSDGSCKTGSVSRGASASAPSLTRQARPLLLKICITRRRHCAFSTLPRALGALRVQHVRRLHDDVNRESLTLSRRPLGGCNLTTAAWRRSPGLEPACVLCFGCAGRRVLRWPRLRLWCWRLPSGAGRRQLSTCAHFLPVPACPALPAPLLRLCLAAPQRAFLGRALRALKPCRGHAAGGQRVRLL